MADTAYDADHLRQAIAAKGALAVIPNNPSRALKYPLDKHLYAQRHLVECCFSKLKQFRRVTTRFEKTARNYRAVVKLSLLSSYGCDKCPHHLVLLCSEQQCRLTGLASPSFISPAARNSPERRASIARQRTRCGRSRLAIFARGRRFLVACSSLPRP
jgi:putative transposase